MLLLESCQKLPCAFQGVLRQMSINDLPVGRSVEETLRLGMVSNKSNSNIFWSQAFLSKNS